jgi:hypothetical protein
MIRALFPLPVFLLPGGVTKLRIFEPRYLSMIKTALKNECGFVLCIYQQDTAHNVPKVGAYVKVIDFNQDSSGQLLIDVKAECLVTIEEVWVDAQNLRHGRVEKIAHTVWSETSVTCSEKDTELSLALEKVYDANPELSQLYTAKQFDNPIWVASRWLEILPVSIKQKENVLQLQRFEQIQDFLHTLIEID